jgi:hypothetical protein
MGLRHSVSSVSEAIAAAFRVDYDERESPNRLMVWKMIGW